MIYMTFREEEEMISLLYRNETTAFLQIRNERLCLHFIKSSDASRREHKPLDIKKKALNTELNTLLFGENKNVIKQ